MRATVHETAKLRDILARPLEISRTQATKMLGHWLARGSLRIPHVDANGVREVSFDPAVVVSPTRRAFSMGERRLAQTLIEDALREAAMPPSQMRDDARSWLRDLGISAKSCFEALDIDYDAAMGRLEALWVAWDADPSSRIRRKPTRKRPRRVA